MKKIFTTILALSLTSFGFAQTLHIFEGSTDVTGDTIVVPLVAGSLNVNDLELHNVSGTDVYYKVSRSITCGTLDADAYVYYCTGTACYSPNSSVNYTPGGADAFLVAGGTLPSGPGTYGVYAHYDAGVACTDICITYKAYNTAASTNDTATVVIQYTCATGIEDANSLASGTISSAFPNPASSVASIKYDLNQYAQKGKICFYDMLGKKVKEIEVMDKKGVAKIDVSEFNSGVYFYSFSVNDKAITTRKLIISK